MVALCLAGIVVAVHVSRAESGKAIILRRDPAQCRRLPAIPRSVSTAGCQAAARQPGLAYPCRASAQSRHARDLPIAVDFGVVVERGKCRNIMGLHRALPSRGYAA